MSNRKTYSKIAKKNRTSINKVKKGMQEAINSAFTNSSNDVLTKAYQNQVPCKGDIPTPDELIKYAVTEIRRHNNINHK